MEPVTHKVCPKCAVDLPASAYYHTKNTKSGLSTLCRPCTIEGVSVQRKIREEGVRALNGGTTPKHRICPDCKRNLPLKATYFPVTPFGILGFSSKCKACYIKANEKHIIAPRLQDPPIQQELEPVPATLPHRKRKKEKLTKLLLPPDTSSPIPDDPEVRAELDAFVKAHEQWK